MKKFFLFLFILIILAGTGFYFGWAQARVPPGSYGVLRTKTHGTDPSVIRDGEVRWVWYKLIPTNAKVMVFTPRRISRQFEAHGTLPSGRHYAALAGINNEFPWAFTGEFSFIIKPESLPSLTERENFTDAETFRNFEERYAGLIGDFITNGLKKLAEDATEMESVLASHVFTGLIADVETAFPHVGGFSCIVRTVNSPDFVLYRAVKELNEEYLSKMRLVLSSDVLKDAEARVRQRIRMDELTQYGEILTKFPVLMQYLLMEKGLMPK